MSKLGGQHAVVTGGGRGIGRAIAEALIADGARVTIMGRNMQTLQTAADEMGAEAVVVDVTQQDSIAEAFSKA
ncbi:MAG: SDR family NAD(P)-dependent oxidoreductase, partial [Chloroflexota bacterium]